MQLVANQEVQNAVSLFFKDSDGSSEDSDVVALEKIRPNRLGLGAQVTAYEQGSTTLAEKRLSNALKRTSANSNTQASDTKDTNSLVNNESSDSDALESRTKSIGQRRPFVSRHAAKKRRKLANAESFHLTKVQETAASTDKTSLTSDQVSANVQLRVKTGDAKLVSLATSNEKLEQEPKRFAANPLPSIGPTLDVKDSEHRAPVRKRTKTRSRQKNLRRDKRDKNNLPAHLTEETLRAGRIRKDRLSQHSSPALHEHLQ